MGNWRICNEEKVSCELGGRVFTKNPAPPATALKPEITSSVKRQTPLDSS